MEWVLLKPMNQSIPSAAGADAPADRPATRGTSDPRAPVPRRVLIVDDNVDAADALCMILEIDGHAVHIVHDGDAALAAVPRHRPEIVLLDIGLPVMDGYEIARRLRTLDAGADTLLCAVTGWGQAEDKRRAEEAGFDHHLVKPVTRETLQRVLQQMPNPATREAESSAALGVQ
jgi:CheY-like chemotaxis protein